MPPESRSTKPWSTTWDKLTFQQPHRVPRTRRKTPSKSCSPSCNRPRHGPQTAKCRRSSSTLAPPFTPNKTPSESCSSSGGRHSRYPQTRKSRRSSSTTAPPFTSKDPNPKFQPGATRRKTDDPPRLPVRVRHPPELVPPHSLGLAPVRPMRIDSAMNTKKQRESSCREMVK